MVHPTALATTICAGLMALAVQASLAAEASDSRLLDGAWTPVKAELAGQPMPEAVLKTISLKLHQGIYEVFVAGQPDKGTYSVNASTKPRSMTIKGTEGPNQGKTFPAIFEITNGMLRVCYDLSGKKRPSEFKTLEGTQLYLVDYRRKQE